MSDDIPRRDAEDVLRVIRDDAGGRPPRDEPPDGRKSDGGTFLLTSVHRIEDGGQDGGQGGGQSGEGRARRGGETIPFRRPPWQRAETDPRAGAAPSRWNGPPSPERTTMGDRRPVPSTVPGLEDPSDGGAGKAVGPTEKPEPLEADPRSGGATGATALDEDAIRRIVEDVLDERLQGEFGRRITRNLKGMVHREVARLLRSGQD